MKKKSHPEFVRALKARNLKITVVGTYENCLSRVAVKCDVCGWEWAPVGGSLLRGHGCPRCAGTMRKSHAEFVEKLKSRRDDVIIVGPYVKALEKARFRFLKCGHEWDVTPAHILNGRGCPLCAHPAGSLPAADDGAFSETPSSNRPESRRPGGRGICKLYDADPSPLQRLQI